MDWLPIFTHMEIAICEPQAIFDLDVDTSLVFEKGDGSNPVSDFEIVVEGGHLFLRDFAIADILNL